MAAGTWPSGSFQYVIDHEEQGRIGTHTVTYRREGQDFVVEVEARILVKLLFITAYRYESDRREVWRGGRLIAYDATTDDNGDEMKVVARANGKGFVIDGPEGRVEAPSQIVPTHPWRLKMMQQKLLMDSEDGALKKVNIRPDGTEQIEIRGRSITARKYLMTGDLERELWYDDDGTWVKMRFKNDGLDVIFTLN